MMGSKATWLSAADSKGGILEANYSLPPHVLARHGFPSHFLPTPTHTPTGIRLRFSWRGKTMWWLLGKNATAGEPKKQDLV